MLDTITEREIDCQFYRIRFGTYLDILLNGTEKEQERINILEMGNVLNGIRKCGCPLCVQILSELKKVEEISLKT